MYSIRCRTILPRSLVFGKPVVRAPRWVPTRQIRTRGAQDPSTHVQPPASTAPLHHPSPSPRPNEAHYADSNHPHKQYFQDDPGEPEFPKTNVKFLAPAIWALAASTGVYVSLAYFAAKKELAKRDIHGQFASFREYGAPSYATRGPPTPTEVVTRAWRETDPISKLSWSLIGFTGAIHLCSMVNFRAWHYLWHVPASGRNYTLFTSTFVHGGLMHLGFNAYAMYNFLPAVGYSPLFRGDQNHMLSFFLATGVLSGFAQHVASALFTNGRPLSPFIPSGGASGALFAVFGAFCMQYPTSGVGVVLIPYYLEAQYFLPAIMLFDLVGMVRGFKGVSLGHAVCLTLSPSWKLG